MTFTYTQYLVHHIPMDVWIAAQARAQRERWTLHGLIVQLLEDYANGVVSPTTTAPLASTIARTDSRLPRRTAVITLRSDRKEHRLQCAAAQEAGGNLLLLNHESELVGRFPTLDIESWFLED